MCESKTDEREIPETQAPDRLVRHYGKIGAPAVVAALNIGKGSISNQTAQEPRADMAAAPAFLFMDDHAA